MDSISPIKLYILGKPLVITKKKFTALRRLGGLTLIVKTSPYRPLVPTLCKALVAPAIFKIVPLGPYSHLPPPSVRACSQWSIGCRQAGDLHSTEKRLLVLETRVILLYVHEMLLQIPLRYV